MTALIIAVVFTVVLWALAWRALGCNIRRCPICKIQRITAAPRARRIPNPRKEPRP